ncbi:MAG: alkaline phosphatase family protein, partial [Terriglobales bacterium]
MLIGKHLRHVCAAVLCAAGLLSLLSCQSAQSAANSRKVIILGVDGLDPDLLTKFMAEGKMPNFARLAGQGSFKRLTTSIPPQSPVAWSNLITGMNAGGHGIFDFIHRDPKTFQLYFSTSKVEGPAHSFHLGKWVVPLGSGSAEQLRHGAAFWEILDEHHIHNFVYRIPANFPPIDAKGKTLSGMGTPDLRGSYGTFTFYTDDPTAAAGAVEGGEIVQ